MIRAVGVLTVVVVALLTIHEAHAACDPSVGCDNKDSVCVKMTFLSYCTNTNVGGSLASSVGYCDVNHQASCGSEKKCDLASGRCVHFCSPDCANGAKCDRVWSGFTSSYKCVSKDLPCGGTCTDGGKCVLGHVCLKVPSLLKDLTQAIAFAADTTFSAIAGFFTSGRKVALKDAATATTGDVVSVDEHANIVVQDGVAVDARDCALPELNVTLKSANAKDDEETQGAPTGPTDDTDGVTPDPENEDELPDMDYMNDTAVPINAETGEQDLPPVDTDATEVQSRRAQLQGLDSVVKSARTFFISMQKVYLSVHMAIFDAFTLALNSGLTVFRAMHVKKGSTVHIGGSAGPVQQAVVNQFHPSIRLQDADASAAPQSQVAFPEKPTGDYNDSSVVFNFLAPVTIAHHRRGRGVQSLMNITVQNNDEVSVAAGVRLAANGTFVATHPRGHFRLHPGAHLRYTGPRFMTGLRLHEQSVFNITTRGARLDRVHCFNHSTFRVASHHILNMPDSYRNAYMKTMWLNDDDAITIGKLETCNTGAKLVFHVKGSFLDEIDEISGAMIKINSAMSGAEIDSFNCTVVIEDAYGDQKELNLVKMSSSVSSFSRTARIQAVRNRGLLQARAHRAKLQAKKRVKLQDDTTSDASATTSSDATDSSDTTADSADYSTTADSAYDTEEIKEATLSTDGNTTFLDINFMVPQSDMLVDDTGSDLGEEAGDDTGDYYPDSTVVAAASSSSSGSGALIGLGVAIALVAVGGGVFLYSRQRKLNKMIEGQAPAHDAHVVTHTHEEDLEMAQKKSSPKPAANAAKSPSNAAPRSPSPAPNASRSAAASQARAPSPQPRAPSPQPNALSPRAPQAQPRAAPTLPARPVSPQPQQRATSPRPQQARAPSPAPVPRPPSRNE